MMIEIEKEKPNLISFLNAIGDGVYIIRDDYTIEFMNESMVADFGEGIRKKCYQVVNRGDEICPWCEKNEVFEGKRLHRDVYIPKVDKTYDVIELPLSNADGSVSKLGILRDISQRIKREEELRTSEENYRRLFENVGCGVYISSKEGKYIDANQALLDMFGYESKEEFLKIDITRDLYLRPEDRLKFQKMIERDGQVIDYEIASKRKDGKIISVLLTSRVRYDQDGNIAGYEGIVVDQSQRRQLIEDYKRLFENVRCGVYISSKEGKFLNANNAFLDMLGYRSKEALLKIHLARDLYLRPEDRQVFQKMIERDGHVIDYEVNFKRQDGTPIPVSLTSHVRYDEQGKVLGYEGVVVDLSQRKQMEKDLSKAEEFFEKVIDSSVNAILVSDMKGAVLLMNESARELFGYPDKAITDKIFAGDLHTPGGARTVLEKLRSHDYGGVGKMHPTEMKALTSSGEEIPVEMTAAIVYEDGKEIAIMAILQDLRPKIEAEKRLEKTRMQLVQSSKLASIGRLAAGVAHEINNPLGGIVMYGHLVLEDLAKEGNSYKNQEKLIAQAERCKSIVKGLLDFSRQREPKIETIDINSIIEDLLSLVERQSIFQNIEITTVLDPNLPLLEGDKSQLQQVFLNLTLNAAEAMAEGGDLTVKTSFFDGTVAIEFTDTGCGIPAEDTEKIFEPFFTTKSAKRGTGLGLAVSHGIINKHKGTISFDSRVNEGTTFTVRLPVGGV